MTLQSIKTKQNATNYLVIGTGERGYSLPVLNLLKVFSGYTKSSIVYTGALSDRFALQMYNSRMKQSKTIEKIRGSDSLHESEKVKRFDDNIKELVDAQNKLINDFHVVFGDIIWVTNKSLAIEDGMYLNLHSQSHLDLSKYLTITPVAPNGDRISGNPLTPRSVQMYRYYNNSVVAPHPVMATRLFAREGVNQALQFMTTGSLRWPTNAKRASETFEHYSQPGAMLITLDNDTGMFYHQRIHIDRNKDGLFIVWDGLVIKNSGVTEAPMQDRLSLVTDSHGPFKSRNVWDAFLKSIEIHNPGVVAHGGDLGDMTSLNPHDSYDTLSHDGLRLSHDFEVFMDDVVEMHNAAPFESDIVILESNHHEWLNRYINKHKTLQGLIGWPNIERQLQAATGRDSIAIREDAPGQESYLWGDFRLRHGHTDGSVIELAKTQGKAINGHYHTHEEFMDAVRIGCACRHMPYMKGANDKWILQIATGTKHQGVARIHAKTVLTKGDIISFSYQGKLKKFKRI
jgi:hypothetical protein